MNAGSLQAAISRKRRFLAYGFQLTALLVPLVLLGYFAGRQLWARRHFRAALELLKHRDFAQAQVHLRACLKVWHRDGETYLLAARTARWAGLFEEAQSLLDHCERLKGPTQAIALEHMLLEAQRGELDVGTERHLWTLIDQQHPAAIQILETLSQVYLYEYRLDGALRGLQYWLRLQPDALQALLWRAQVRQAFQQFDDAVKDLQRAVELSPDEDEGLVQLANLLLYLQRAGDAQEKFEELRQRQPGDPAVLLGLARCRYRLGQVEDAEQLLDKVLAEHPQYAGALRERGRIALDKGRPAEAEPWLQKCLALAADNRETLFLLSRCYERLGRPDEARECLAKQKELDGHLLRLQELARLIAASPRDAALRYEAGIICLQNGREEEGMRWLIGALRVVPNHRPTHQALAKYYEQAGRPELAARHRQSAAD